MSRRLVVAHPSADLYGSDLQLVQTVRGMADAGWQVLTLVPAPGPLIARLEAAGSAVRVLPFPVLRKAVLTPGGLARTAAGAAGAAVRGARLLRALGADRVLVNTVTIPSWIAAARLARVPVITHVHEAEVDLRRLLRVGLAAPLLLSDRVVANSEATREAQLEAIPALRSRLTVVHNGVDGPPEPVAPPRPRAAADPARIAVIGRLSRRKGVDVALAAVGLLAAHGRAVRLDICGSVFPGYEAFEEELRARAAQPDLAGMVTFHGYVDPTWKILADADVVLVPSLGESFGNAAVEAMLAARPLVASGVQALREVVTDGRTGLLVPPGDADALAAAIARLLDDPAFAGEVALAARADALDRFSTARYRAGLLAAIEG